MTSLLARKSLASVLALALSISGCTPKEPETQQTPAESPPAGWPAALNDLSATWTADPGIDLTTGAAVVVRAYIESYYLAYLTDDEKYLYPGFREAVDPNDSDGPPGTEALWPEPPNAATWVGTLRHHLLRITRSGRDVTVLGCLYSYAVGRLGDEFGFRPNNGSGFGPDAGISPIRIGLRAPESDESTFPPQEGKSRAPFNDVFGGWRVTSHEGGYLVKGRWADSMSDKAECASRDRTPPESRTFTPGQEYPRSDFPTLPATPGWPDKPAS
jgi:hypothetical protein